MGLMTKHGFHRLNLNKIQAGQHIGLWKWVNTLELIGYKLEGYISQTHCRDFIAEDSVRVGITKDCFLEIVNNRGGDYFGGEIEKLIKNRRKENMCFKLRKVLDNLYAE